MTSAEGGTHGVEGRGHVFFACAYSNERVSALRGIIRETVEGQGYRLEAPALQPGGGGLWRVISTQIDASCIGFYDYREPNMNVAAEMGYAVARGKPAVVLTTPETFSAVPRPMKPIFSVTCADDGALVDTLIEFLERQWPPGHYDWNDLRPTTPRFERAATRDGRRIVAFGGAHDLTEELCDTEVVGYAVAGVSPETAASPDEIVDLTADADAALFMTSGKAPPANSLTAAGAEHVLAGACLARGLPIRVLHRSDVAVASDLVGEAVEVAPGELTVVIRDFLSGLAAGPATLSLRPQVDDDLVSRQLLLDRLSGKRTLFLWAEPGYGKSILLAQLVGPTALWVTCNERTTSGQVLATIARELARALPGAGSSALRHAQRPTFDPLEWRDALLDDLARAEPGPQVELVLDDAHLLSARTLRALSSISQSRRVRLFVAGRDAPGVPEAVAADPYVLRADDLSFSLEETERLFARVDVEAGTIRDLHHRSEGWPYALALARDLVRLKGPSGVAALSGGRRELAVLFQESIFNAMSPAEREVVEAVALTSTLRIDEVEWVVKGEGAATTLASLAERPMFVVEHGEEVPTYRLHSLYREFVLKRLASARGLAWLRESRRDLAQRFRHESHHVAALRVAEEGEAWDIAVGAIRDMLPVANRFVARYLRDRLAAIPASEWEGDPVLLRFAIQHDFDRGEIGEAERLTRVFRQVAPDNPFVEYFSVWSKLQRGTLTSDDVTVLARISGQVAALDADAAGAMRIAQLELESRLQPRPSPDELASKAAALATMGSDEVYSPPVRGEASLQAGWIYSRAFFGAYVANLTRLRTRAGVIGHVSLDERLALASEPLRWQSLASDLISRAASLLPIDEDPVARARFLQTAGVTQGNGALAVSGLSGDAADPGLFDIPIRLLGEAVELWRGLRMERSELLALTEKAQLLLFSGHVDEGDSLLTEVDERAAAAGWPEIVAKCRAVRAVRELSTTSWKERTLADLDEDGIDRYARSLMDDLDISQTDEHVANVRAEIKRLVLIEREKRSHCRHIDLVEHRNQSAPHENLGREICPCSIVCPLVRVEHFGGTRDVQEPIAAFKGRYCLGCPLREPLPPK